MFGVSNVPNIWHLAHLTHLMGIVLSFGSILNFTETISAGLTHPVNCWNSSLELVNGESNMN